MKPTKTSELRNLKSGEIETKLSDAREELMKLRFQQVTGQLTDTSRLRILRREIARMQTLLREQTSEQAKKAEAVTEGEA